MNAKRLFGLMLVAPALLAIVYCGSGDSSTPSTPTPTAAPTAAPPPVLGPLVCDPTPPPLHSIKVKVQQNLGFKKTLDSSPRVNNVDGYCQATGQDGNFCWTRLEGNPQREDCDRMAMGIAGDTGRYGPTWYFDGAPCQDLDAGEAGCANNAENQFLVTAKSEGNARVAACAADDVPVDGDRCGECIINAGSDRCQ